MSKAHHPDLHPNDKTAAERFVQISEAHATLASPEKRAVYDRDFLRANAASSSGGGAPRSGSYSSASSPAGGRPASGLSRRRTQFRGPPPSFYQSGGWGEQSQKRSDYASRPSHAHEAQDQTQGPGFGPGGFTSGFDNDVPHFDHRGHYETHSGIERTRHKARRKGVGAERDEVNYGQQGNSMLSQFVMICGVLGITYAVTNLMTGLGPADMRRRGNDGAARGSGR